MQPPHTPCHPTLNKRPSLVPPESQSHPFFSVPTLHGRGPVPESGPSLFYVDPLQHALVT